MRTDRTEVFEPDVEFTADSVSIHLSYSYSFTVARPAKRWMFVREFSKGWDCLSLPTRGIESNLVVRLLTGLTEIMDNISVKLTEVIAFVVTTDEASQHSSWWPFLKAARGVFRQGSSKLFRSSV
jgi:hypothetical protein